ncbi:MAG: hypothetical protein PWP34_2682 [Desulfuromonadales bacterium]|jgi:uncharacterized coiled-coil DUF342 family protein|nr:hypothetical protein [Desulfuromonadales bacterium]
MESKEAYEKKLQAQLDEWNAEIAKLKAKADKAEAEARIEYHQRIEELRAMQETARSKLDKLKAAGDNAWQDLKEGLDQAWEDLGKAVKAARSRFS